MKKVQIGRSRMLEELARPTWEAASKPVREHKKKDARQPQKVETISSAPTKQKKLKAAAYARVSTDLDSQETSIENQRELRRRKDALYAERAEHANTEVQIRLLLELVDEMVKDSLPEWMQTHASTDGRKKGDDVIAGGSADGGAQEKEADGSCRDYDDFFSRTRYIVPEGVLDENGRMESFNNDLVIRYLDRVIVNDDGYEVVFKAGVKVEVEV